jgi:hypothetical protein
VTVSYSSSSSLSSDGKSFFVFDTFYKFAVLLLLFGLVMRARWAGQGWLQSSASSSSFLPTGI